MTPDGVIITAKIPDNTTGAGIDVSSCDSNASEISGDWLKVRGEANRGGKTPESSEDAKPPEDLKATASIQSEPSTASSS